MEKIDRLGWSSGISLISFGIRFGIRVTDAALLESLRSCLPPVWKPCRSSLVDFLYSLDAGTSENGTKRFHSLYNGSVLLLRTRHLSKACELLKQSLELNIVWAARNNQLFVHAGVVGWRGKAIVLPGRSMSGKSNMVAALVKAGATYYSDEFAVFDAEGRVHPYPRTLRLRNPGTSMPVERSVRKIGKRPLPVGLVAALKYRPRATWQPISLSPAETMFALLDNTVMARHRPKQSLSILKMVSSTTSCIRSSRDEAEQIAPLLLSYLE